MSGDLIVFVYFELVRDMLLNDENLSSQGQHRRHQRIGSLDRHNGMQFHGLNSFFQVRPSEQAPPFAAGID